MKFTSICLYIFALVFLSCNTSTHPTASLVITNARIWTGNVAEPWAEAMAVNADTIVFVGDEASCKKFISDSTEIVDAGAQLIVPGFIDSHVHFLDGGYSLQAVQLREVSSKKEFIDRIAEYAKTLPQGVWISGGIWNHQNWGGELPEASWIDSVTPNNPVWLNRIDGHMGLANSLALKMAGLTNDAKNISGGEIIRDKNGKITGIFKDNAQSLIADKIAAPPLSIQEKAIDAAMKLYASKGITSIQNMGYGWHEQELFKKTHDELADMINYFRNDCYKVNIFCGK